MGQTQVKSDTSSVGSKVDRNGRDIPRSGSQPSIGADYIGGLTGSHSDIDRITGMTSFTLFDNKIGSFFPIFSPTAAEVQVAYT